MTPAESSWPQHSSNPAENPPPPAVPMTVAAQPPLDRKSPLLAGLLSGFPGLGNVYNGLYLRGMIQFMIVGALMTLVEQNGVPFLVMALIFFWAFSILDAYRQAVLINYGYAQDLGLLDQPRRPQAGQGGLIAGVILTILGLIALIEQYVAVDLDWLYDMWPVLLVGTGVWLIVASIREKRRAEGV